MRADSLVYNLSTGSIRASGDVQIVLEDGSVTHAEEVEADEGMNVAVASELDHAVIRVRRLLQLPLALAMSALFALAVGALSLRTRGVYFIMITLAFAQMIYYVAVGLDRYGGDDGMTTYRRAPSDSSQAEERLEPESVTPPHGDKLRGAVV